MPTSIKPTVLVILDGFGYAKATKHNAIAQANMPHFKQWLQEYPHTLLQASGTAVGLPEGYIGNSEVGHLTIGAGRTVKQDLVRINEAIASGAFFTNPTVVNNFTTLAQNGHTLHLMGLLSDAGVHSHIDHLVTLLEIAKSYNIATTYLHLFLDGRDVPPRSAKQYLSSIQTTCNRLNYGRIGSICGRFYAMDRDGNWQRTQQCYDTITQQQPHTLLDWQQALDYYYKQDITDEFIPPTQLEPDSIVRNGDGVFFFNFRPDRARQLTQAFTDPLFNHFTTKKYKLTFFITMTDYDHAKYHTQSMFKKIKLYKTLKDALNAAGKSIFSIAETEKYAHVTYFFNGMREKKLPLETRVLIPSLPTKNYVNHPKMSAAEITKTVLHSLKTDPKNFYLINYANADMVGHSGDITATIKAVEFLDTQLQQLYEQIVVTMNGTLYITADHGKAEDMYDEKAHQPQTAHTKNPVYFVMINKELKNNSEQLHLNQLNDIAPFILQHLAVPVPQEMQTTEQRKN